MEFLKRWSSAMKIDYKFTPVLVKKVIYVTHKGKRPGHQGDLHIHKPEFCEIIFVDYGKIMIFLQGRRIIVGCGECIFIPGGVKHSISGAEDAPFDFLNIAFFGKVPESIFSKSIPVNRKCLELLQQMKQESIQTMPYSNDVIACCLTEFIVHLLRQCEFSIPMKLMEPLKRQNYQSEMVNRTIKVIEGEYSKPLCLKQISRALGISGPYLCSLIRKETGETFSSILHRQRVSAAKHLLSESIFSIEEISNAVGYSSLSFFFKIFKRMTGITPKAYAQSLGEPTIKE
jgi:AraC-like DNA-binding protein/mannose-6-phosphate isomerase-like protein (cupin superfamily)